MSPADVLTTPDVLIALGFFVLVGVIEPFIEFRLNRALAGNHAFHWSWEHVVEPLARAATIVVFVYLAYPAIFGLRSAPEFNVLLAENSLRINNLVGILFLCTLLLPIIPLFQRRVELVLPLQGIVAVAVVFTWFTDYLGASAASPWPGTMTALALAGIVFFGHRVAASMGQRLGHELERILGKTGYERLVMNAMELLAQAPVMLLYGYALGRKIAI